MAGLHHVPVPEEPRDPAAERHNARLGLALFAFYLIAYGAYVAVNAFWPAVMDAVPVGGLNVAVLWGMALIVGAFALALVYAALCHTPRGDRA
jgi:uncharacterized membrane protein (DUF485 family)